MPAPRAVRPRTGRGAAARLATLAAATLAASALLLGCAGKPGGPQWTEEEVTFAADGLTLHGTYRHRADGASTPAALLISESGQTDRNGDNPIAGPVGTMRDIADELSARGVASLRYDKVGAGRTGLGRYAADPAGVGSAVFTGGARAALRHLADRPGTDRARLGVYAVGEGAVHAMALAAEAGGPGYAPSASCSRWPGATSTSSPPGCRPTTTPRRRPAPAAAPRPTS